MLLTVGDLIEDVVVWLPGPVALGSDTVARITRERGGSAANVAAAVVRAGGRARFVGQLGDDDLGERMLASLSSVGVDVAARFGGRTGSIVVLVDASGERTMLTDRAAATELSSVDPAWLDGVEVLHLPAYSLFVDRLARSCLELAGLARERGIPLAIDPSSAALLESYGVERFLSLLADLGPAVLFPNRDEAAVLGIGETPPPGVGLVVEKDGAAPVRLVSAEGVTEVPVPPVVGVVDTTGAGDAFAAGFLLDWAAGKPPPSAAARGSEVAAHVLRGPGGDRCVGAGVRVSEEVASALAGGGAVVALESTIFSEFGLPAPTNRECLAACVAAVRSAGAVPALTVVLEGEARVGVDEAEWPRVLAADRKLGARDVPVAVAGGWPSGATTVSGALSLAAAAGITVFATGGIGGVHRDVAETGDVSADLPAIARYPVTTVTAGAKAFLDLPRTVELLETLGVPVLGLDTDEFPAFYSRTSGVPLPHRVGSATEAADVVRAARDLGWEGGVVVAVPIPEEAALPDDALDAAIDTGLAAATAAGITGAAVTPFVLGRLVDATGGGTLDANVALAVNNARVAAELAGALAG